MFLKTTLVILIAGTLIQVYAEKKLERDKICYLPIMIGNGTNWEVRWAFADPPGTCTPFHYGGQGGNRNNFFTQRECWSYCYL